MQESPLTSYNDLIHTNCVLIRHTGVCTESFRRFINVQACSCRIYYVNLQKIKVWKLHKPVNSVQYFITIPSVSFSSLWIKYIYELAFPCLLSIYGLWFKIQVIVSGSPYSIIISPTGTVSTKSYTKLLIIQMLFKYTRSCTEVAYKHIWELQERHYTLIFWM